MNEGGMVFAGMFVILLLLFIIFVGGVSFVYLGNTFLGTDIGIVSFKTLKVGVALAVFWYIFIGSDRDE